MTEEITPPTAYQKSLVEWRAEMDASLRAENSWLALAGLLWLQEGTSTIGRGAGNTLVLPGGGTPVELGRFTLERGQVSFSTRHRGLVKVNHAACEQAILQPDVSGEPDIIEAGDLRMILIQRGKLFGIRVWDNSREERRTFPGRIWYTIDPSYKILADFIEYDPPKSMLIPSVLGKAEEEFATGEIQFQLEGRAFKLDALSAGAGGLFVIFSDLSNEDSTYPAGRFLVTEPPAGGKVELDFNKAYNPPCAFTPFATCPLPPPQNSLEIRVEAGEKFRKGLHGHG
jgi:uncharacterized protein (DUF1684 family)